MEKRIESKVHKYINTFKDDIKEKMNELGLVDVTNSDNNMSNLLRYIFDYQGVDWDKDDFTRRKRVKNCVPSIDRCMAKRANGEQCTRRRKDNFQYCGTHSKGTPHGEYQINSQKTNEDTVIELTVHDINGIMYYIDNDNNVYNQAHVLSNKLNPDCVGKRIALSDGRYKISYN
uniref:Uncharacterized protein n=1 Tax=viral metagenome TaxID=1070528 RepID=A0A6C0BRQ4_9ZZZZ